MHQPQGILLYSDKEEKPETLKKKKVGKRKYESDSSGDEQQPQPKKKKVERMSEEVFSPHYVTYNIDILIGLFLHILCKCNYKNCLIALLISSKIN